MEALGGFIGTIGLIGLAATYFNLFNALFFIKKPELHTKKNAYILYGIITILGGYIGSEAAMQREKDEAQKVVNNYEKNDKSKTQKPENNISQIDYEVIEQSKIKGIKYSVNIRLKEKITLKQIKQFANKYKNNLDEDYERIFMNYYLPETIIGNGSWAMSHFTNNNLNAQIIGITIAQENNLKKHQVNEKVIGDWLYEVLKHRIVIYEKNGQTFSRTFFTDGSGGTKQLIVKNHLGQKRYYEQGEPEHQYMTINKKGFLEFYENNEKYEMLIPFITRQTIDRLNRSITVKLFERKGNISSTTMANICIGKELGSMNSYYYEIKFITKDNVTITGGGLLSPKVGSKKQSCFEENTYFYANKENEQYQKIEKHLKKGNIKTCKIDIWTTSDKIIKYGSNVINDI